MSLECPEDKTPQLVRRPVWPARPRGPASPKAEASCGYRSDLDNYRAHSSPVLLSAHIQAAPMRPVWPARP
eukprot:CAMPEP_0181396782 /NCGR_PEP_ID=MMETSP1110-20121109/96_1 /TAXON_ID=174948 /ORGANISM="Symbiodinium sp., Strain CCMP421" /LENGTH=70 /DNA_ID=CAMNT_0023518499 /DNA_START=75 /DNA_END=284 /DNA_ORIENTATION=+